MLLHFELETHWGCLLFRIRMLVELIKGRLIPAFGMAILNFFVQNNFLAIFSEHLGQSSIVQLEFLAGPASGTGQQQVDNRRAVSLIVRKRPHLFYDCLEARDERFSLFTSLVPRRPAKWKNAQMLIDSAWNAKSSWLCCNDLQIQQNTVFESVLSDIGDGKVFAFHIAGEHLFAWRKMYRFATTAGFGVQQSVSG